MCICVHMRAHDPVGYSLPLVGHTELQWFLHRHPHTFPNAGVVSAFDVNTPCCCRPRRVRQSTQQLTRLHLGQLRNRHRRSGLKMHGWLRAWLHRVWCNFSHLQHQGAYVVSGQCTGDGDSLKVMTHHVMCCMMTGNTNRNK
jgi:hypothetical protein